MSYDFREDLLFSNLKHISRNRNKKNIVNWYPIMQCLNSNTNGYKFRQYYDEKSVRSRVYRVEKAVIGKKRCKTCASYRGAHICATEFELAYYKPIIARMATKLWEESESKEDSDLDTVEYTELEQEEAPQEEAYLLSSKDDWDDDWDESAFYEGLETYGLATYNVCNLELDISE